MTDLTASTEVIPFHGQQIEAHRADDDLWIVFRPIVEQLGIGYSSQLQRLRRASWASCGHINTTGADGKRYDMVTVNRRTLTMWLATIQENKINEAARPLLALYQSESAGVLDSYWHDGGAINPRATSEQLDAITAKAQQRLQLLSFAKGMVDDTWLETKVRHQIAVGLGEEPEIEPMKRTLTVSDYLDGKGVNDRGQRKFASSMGALVKKSFRELHDKEPGSAVRFINGADRPVAAYTERDRALFDKAWAILGSAIEPEFFKNSAAAA